MYRSILLTFLFGLGQVFGADSGATVTGGNLKAGSITASNLTALAIVGADSSKKLVSSTLTVSEANALHSTPPATAANLVIVSNRLVSAESNLTSVSNRVVTLEAGSGSGGGADRVLTNNGTAYGLTVRVLTNALASGGMVAVYDQQKRLTNGTHGIDEYLLSDNDLSDLLDYPTAQINLHLQPGVDVQVFDSDLAALASISTTGLYNRTGSGTGAAVNTSAGLAGAITDVVGTSGFLIRVGGTASNAKVPKYNTDGTITWQADDNSGTSGLANSSGNGTNETFWATTIQAGVTEFKTTTLTASGGTVTLSLTNSTWYDHTLTADVTLALSDTTTATNRPVSLDLYCNGTHSITWPAGAVLPSYTNQPFAAGLLEVTIRRKSGTNYISWPNLIVNADVAPLAGIALSKLDNKVTLTQPASGSTLTILNGKTLTANNTLTLAGTDSTTITFQGTGTVVNRDSTDSLTNKKISHSTLSTDDTYTGVDITGLNNSGGVTQWDAVYLNSSSQWVLADANGSGTYPCRGLAVTTTATANATTVVVQGVVRNDAWTWTPGGTIYLSTTAGGLTQVVPSTTGDKVQTLGFAIDADTIRLFPSGDYGTAP